MLALPLRHSLLRVPPVSVLKWTASAFQIMGYTATALALTPLNIYLFLAGLIGSCIVDVPRMRSMAGYRLYKFKAGRSEASSLQADVTAAVSGIGKG